MFCSNCGSEVVSGAKFCPKCGTPVEEDVEVFTKEENLKVGEKGKEETEVETVKESLAQKKEDNEKKILDEAEKEDERRLAPEEEQTPFVMTSTKRNKEKGLGTTVNGLTVIIVILILLIVIGIVLIVGLKVIVPMFDSGENQMVYMEDGDLYYLKDMTKPDKAIKIDATRDMGYLTGAQFSEDGKYLYFYNEMDDSGYTYTLNCVKLSKLKKDGNNDKYIEEIASDVMRYRFTDKGVLYYLDDKNCLIENKNGKERDLEKHVNSFIFNENESKLYCQSYDEEDYELCVVNLSDGKSKSLDDKISGFYSFQDKDDFLVYYKYTDEDSYLMDVYVVSGAKEPVCVAEDVYSIIGVDSDTGKVYYQIRNEEEISLYEFVNDTASAEDAEVKKPTLLDGLVNVTEDQVLDACISEYEEEEYRTGEKKDLEKYYNQLSYDGEYDLYYDYGFDDNQDYYYDENKKQWYVYDSDQYDAKYEEYNKVANRLDLREELKNADYSVESYDVYSVDVNKKETEIIKDVLSVSMDVKNNIIMYAKKGETVEKIDIKEIEYTDDVTDFVNDTYGSSGKMYYKIDNGVERVLEVDSPFYIADCTKKGKLVLYNCEYDEERGYYYTLYCADVKDSKISKVTKVTDEAIASSAQWMDGILYYLAEANDDDEVVADLYKYENGKSKQVLKGVSTGIHVTADGKFYEAYDNLVLYDANGENEKIAKDVTSVSYLAKNKIVYESDEDLYVYDGKEEIRIARDSQGYILYVEQIGEDVKDYQVSYDNYY